MKKSKLKVLPPSRPNNFMKGGLYNSKYITNSSLFQDGGTSSSTPPSPPSKRIFFAFAPRTGTLSTSFLLNDKGQVIDRYDSNLANRSEKEIQNSLKSAKIDPSTRDVILSSIIDNALFFVQEDDPEYLEGLPSYIKSEYGLDIDKIVPDFKNKLYGLTGFKTIKSKGLNPKYKIKIPVDQTFIREAENASKISQASEGVPSEIIVLSSEDDLRNKIPEALKKYKGKNAEFGVFTHSGDFLGLDAEEFADIFKQEMDPNQKCGLFSCYGLEQYEEGLKDIPNLVHNIGSTWKGSPRFSSTEKYKGKNFYDIMYGIGEDWKYKQPQVGINYIDNSMYPLEKRQELYKNFSDQLAKERALHYLRVQASQSGQPRPDVLPEGFDLTPFYSDEGMSTDLGTVPVQGLVQRLSTMSRPSSQLSTSLLSPIDISPLPMRNFTVSSQNTPIRKQGGLTLKAQDNVYIPFNINEDPLFYGGTLPEVEVTATRKQIPNNYLPSGVSLSGPSAGTGSWLIPKYIASNNYKVKSEIDESLAENSEFMREYINSPDVRERVYNEIKKANPDYDEDTLQFYTNRRLSNYNKNLSNVGYRFMSDAQWDVENWDPENWKTLGFYDNDRRTINLPANINNAKRNYGTKYIWSKRPVIDQSTLAHETRHALDAPPRGKGYYPLPTDMRTFYGDIYYDPIITYREYHPGSKSLRSYTEEIKNIQKNPEYKKAELEGRSSDVPYSNRTNEITARMMELRKYLDDYGYHKGGQNMTRDKFNKLKEILEQKDEYYELKGESGLTDDDIFRLWNETVDIGEKADTNIQLVKQGGLTLKNMKKLKLQNGGNPPINTLNPQVVDLNNPVFTNPFPYYGKAGNYYKTLLDSLTSQDLFKGMDNKSKFIGNTFGSLFDLNTAEADELLNRKREYFDNVRAVSSWAPFGMSQDGGSQDMGGQSEGANAPKPDINKSINVIKSYAEQMGFTNEDGSISAPQMQELLFLLETDMNADLERGMLSNIMSYFEESDKESLEEQFRKYWNRGVIPMNRREDVLKYSSEPVPHLEDGNNFPDPETAKNGGKMTLKNLANRSQNGGGLYQTNPMQQAMGYKDNSPYRNLPFQLINSPNITMQGVSKPLMGIADTGATAYMQPGYNYNFPGASSVLELPLMQRGGRVGRFFRGVGDVFHDFGLSVADRYGNTLGLGDIDNSKYRTKFGQRMSGFNDKVGRFAGKLGATLAPILVPGMGNTIGSTLTSGINRLEQQNLANASDPSGTGEYSNPMGSWDFSSLVPLIQNTLINPYYQSNPTSENFMFPNPNLMMEDPNNPNPIMKEGGIPQRYKDMGFTRTGQKKDSTREGKKWMTLAEKDGKYKVVHGGYEGMEDFTQHRNKNRQENFWNRMGGRNSAKANDKFSPLYWHRKFGTWENGGMIAPPPPKRPF